MNDYGFELLSAREFDWRALIKQGLFSEENLLRDVLDSLNASELAQRRFREIARVAGLVFQGFPGAPQVNAASAGLLQPVLPGVRKHDQGQPAVVAGRREALDRNWKSAACKPTLERMRSRKLTLTHPPRFTPFSFPLMVERLRVAVSTESVGAVVQRLLDGTRKRGPTRRVRSRIGAMHAIDVGGKGWSCAATTRWSGRHGAPS